MDPGPGNRFHVKGLKYAVFLSHAGEEKKIFVDHIHKAFRGTGVHVFMDQHELHLGDYSLDEMEHAAHEAAVGVFVLSKHFVTKEWPMKELGWMLERWKSDKNSVSLIPVFFRLSYHECENVRDLYEAEDTWTGKQKPAEEQLERWAKSVENLLKFTGQNPETYNHFEGEMVDGLADAICEKLKVHKLLPAAFRRAASVGSPMNVIRLTKELVGREEEVKWVMESLAAHKTVVVWGGPGEGKSSVVAEAACQLWETGRSPGGALRVDFADAQHGASVRQLIAMQLMPYWNTNQATVPDSKRWDAVLRWLKHRSQMLLLFENCEDFDVLQVEEFETVLERDLTSCGTLLATSRASLTPVGAEYLELYSLAPSAAIKLLRSVSSKCELSSIQAEKLVELCGCNALAITVIGAFLQNGKTTPQSAIEAAEEDLRTVERAGRGGSVAAKFLVKRISQLWLCRYLLLGERQALARLSVFGGSFSEEGAAAVGVGEQPAKAADLLKHLHHLSLLQPAQQSAGQVGRSSKPRYVMHKLIVGIAREFLTGSSINPSTDPSPSSKPRYAMRKLMLLVGIAREFLTGCSSNVSADPSLSDEVHRKFLEWMVARGKLLKSFWNKLGGLQPAHILLAEEESNIQRLIRLLEDNKVVPEFGELDDLAVPLLRYRRLQQAEALFRQELGACKAAVGPDHTSTAMSWGNLGCVLRDQGKLEEAEMAHREALQIFQETRGSDHTDTASSWCNLGCVLTEQGKLAEAEVAHREDLRVTLQQLGPDDISTAVSWNNLGGALQEQGKLEEAEAAHREALRVKQARLGPDHTSTAGSLGNLGLVLNKQGKLDEAEAAHREALRVFQEKLGPDHTSTALVRNNLGSVLNEQGKLAESEVAHREALQVMLKQPWPDHTTLARIWNNLGAVLSNQGKLAEAEAALREFLRVSQQKLAPNHTSTVTAWSHMGFVLSKQGKLDEAEAAHRGALRVTLKQLRLDHTSTAMSWSNLGNVLSEQGKLAEAEAAHREALLVKQANFGPDHTSTAVSWHRLGLVLWEQGKLEAAEAALREALRVRQAHLGPNHTSTAMSWCNLGSVLWEQSKLAEFEVAYRKALRIFQENLWPDHTSTAKMWDTLGGMLSEQGKPAEAEAAHREALRVKHAHLGPDHISTAISWHRLGLVLREQGKLKEAEAAHREGEAAGCKTSMTLEILSSTTPRVARPRAMLGP